MKLIYFLVLPFLCPITALALELSEECPPGFEKTDANQCKLRTMYEFYNSIQNKGVGGTTTSLPSHRDGFSPEQIDLGRLLFFDPILSSTQKISCATCHLPSKGFSDGEPRSIGLHGKRLRRAAPTIWNVAFLKSFFWDARATTLEAQILGPLFSPEEMGNTKEELFTRLNKNKTYRTLFAKAFPQTQQNRITEPQLYRAIIAFQTSLISLNSAYDRYVHGHKEALTENQIKGMNVYRSFVARCSECHTPPLFTNQQVAVIGAPEPDGLPFDPGAETTYTNKKLRGGFKVPTLRNIVKTPPYMHSGKFSNLRDAVEFYNKGRGHAVPPEEDLTIHWHIWEPKLKDNEIDLIVEFLGALTDESFMPKIPDRVPSGLVVEGGLLN